ncbi:MAG TPA: hypothetical protein VN894_01145 [Polyangiaceae bacterium]|nr:hypothetical protein [Polyangiaceae bacterium]
MRELPFIVLVLPSVACMQIGTDSSTGSGGSATPVASGAGASAAAPSGTNCVQDPMTQIVLCEETATCPGVDVDPGAFPNCGFRLNAAASLDLECLCSDALCPVGVPTTCAQAQTLLEGQSALLVCQQQAEGRCIDFVTPDAGGSSCDPACRDECVGAASCLQLCGC